jgi:predicted O-methyltransferase YrrM
MTTATLSQTHVHAPINLDTVIHRASSAETKRDLLGILKKLESEPYLDAVIQSYQSGLDRFGGDWQYVDLISVIHAYASLMQPEWYLEIGVRRGRSLAAAYAACPTLKSVGFDLWLADYAGASNEGELFVRREVSQAADDVDLELITGNSRETVPEFLKRPNTPATFDMITVDGDHRAEGARIDLDHTLPLIAPGGIVMFDDIIHPDLPHLAGVWEDAIAQFPQFAVYTNTTDGTGLAVAMNPTSAVPRGQ